MSFQWKQVGASFDPNFIRQSGTRVDLLQEPGYKPKEGERALSLHGTVPIDTDGDGREDQQITVSQTCETELTWPQEASSRSVEFDRWGNAHIVTGNRKTADGSYATIVDEAKGARYEARNITQSHGIRFRERVVIEARDLISGRIRKVSFLEETGQTRGRGLELPPADLFDCSITQGTEVFVGHFNGPAGGEQIAVVGSDGMASVYEWTDRRNPHSIGVSKRNPIE